MAATPDTATAPCPGGPPRALGVYKPRRPQASPLFRLVQDHLRPLQTVYDEQFAATYGPWRPVVREVADKFLACGILDHGFARVRCEACAEEYLLAFSCKARYFCPSCHAKRVTLWTLWLEETLLAPVPHRQVVLALPKRLRAYCLYRRGLLGDIARVAAHTITAAIRTLTGEPELAVGIVACLQTHGSLANWHPHLHLLVTDGGVRADGTFVEPSPVRFAPNPAQLATDSVAAACTPAYGLTDMPAERGGDVTMLTDFRGRDVPCRSEIHPSARVRCFRR